ncbi:MULTISPECIES: EF-hand domain-containing protein [unclassified Sphingomonas]|uniref:EF-hand domain-containing protein n=1 Tax=unclassified Sphingomonas TaxID=196159 RepID=UPI001F23B267|nr:MULTISPECIES: EF-hand domain-containing protein [unclassified Sphingomonas]
MKRILLASAMMVSAPAFAQDTAPAQTTAPATQAAPQTSPTAPADASIAATQPAPATQADPATQTAQTTAEAGQPASGTQIAQIVEAEFPKYDKDGKGQLTEKQFGEWMVALRSASEPGVTADKPEVKSWVKQAFAQADKDKSKAVTKAELTSFLSKSA